MGAPAEVAGSMSREWKRHTRLPSVLVPSGKSSTGTGNLSRSVILSATDMALAMLERSRKMVPPAPAALPK
jgi:hypothetical protein